MRFSSKQILIQIYFIFFIFLNIIDFLNIISGDLDFFKKILSWTIIGYIFYKVSFCKIFIGKRNKLIDLFYIFSFLLITIPKSLLIYTKNIVNFNEYTLFGKLLSLIYNIPAEIMLISLPIIGIILSIIISISLLSNNTPLEKSLIYSLNIKNNFFKPILENIALIIYTIFFALIIFNFFMEWFALAVDSIILVLGLIYYLFNFIHSHTNTKLSSYFKNVSNTGNEFYKNLISTFSDKKTIFIGASFLLTLHLLVDVGVYIIPYSIGTENALYFQDLNTIEREHLPLINFKDFSNSQIYKDLSYSNSDFFINFSTIIVYITTLSLFFILLIMPFYIFYKNIKHEPIILHKTIVIILLTSLIIFGTNFLLEKKGFEIQNPIKIGYPQTQSINGVDLYTNNIISPFSSTILIPMTMFLLITIILILTFNKYEKFYHKLSLISILIFFISYMFIFYISTIENEFNSLSNSISQNIETQEYINSLSYEKLINTYETTNMKNLVSKNEKFYGNILSYKLFSEIKNEHQYDFIMGEIKGNNKTFNYGNENKIFLSPQTKFNYKKSQIESETFTFIYFLGENQIQYENNLPNEISFEEIKSQINTKNTKNLNSSLLNSKKTLEIIRLIFSSIFYIFGTISFSIFYIRKNLIEN